ncbi:hypothetical protein PFISCL1PPCAC_25794, partial [Pristionchus fissidentatus]
SVSSESSASQFTTSSRAGSGSSLGSITGWGGCSCCSNGCCSIPPSLAAFAFKLDAASRRVCADSSSCAMAAAGSVAVSCELSDSTTVVGCCTCCSGSTASVPATTGSIAGSGSGSGVGSRSEATTGQAGSDCC